MIDYRIVPDEADEIRNLLKQLTHQQEVQVAILNGGTGLSKRDVTYETVSSLLDKELTGFGELFRWLSYEEIGPFAILSRAIAGAIGRMLVFSLPGSKAAVELAMERLILPVLGHGVHELEKER